MEIIHFLWVEQHTLSSDGVFLLSPVLAFIAPPPPICKELGACAATFAILSILFKTPPPPPLLNHSTHHLLQSIQINASDSKPPDYLCLCVEKERWKSRVSNRLFAPNVRNLGLGQTRTQRERERERVGLCWVEWSGKKCGKVEEFGNCLNEIWFPSPLWFDAVCA